MKKNSILLFAIFIALTTTKVIAQNLPQASPAASVSQTFGITKVQIDYHCPGVKNRVIFGGLVPYDSVWRTGANEATTILFSTDVNINGQKIKRGKYALFTIPGKDTWIVILNSEADQWGAFNYNKSKDVLRFTVNAETVDSKEKMSFYIDAVNDTMARITLSWDKVKIGFDVSAKTNLMVQKDIDNTWRNLANDANYAVDNKLDLNKAEQWAQASVGLQESFYNRYVLARVLQAKGNNKEALKYAEDAKKLGDALGNDNFYNENKNKIDKLIAELSAAKK